MWLPRQWEDWFNSWRRHSAKVLPSTGGTLRVKRFRIAFWAVVAAIIAGLIELPLPVEDAYRAVRAELRSHPAPDDILVVAIDDRTLNTLGVPLPDRRDDAKLIDALFAAGANRVYFDRAYADPSTPQVDKAFAAALGRYPGRTFLGGSPAYVSVGRNHAELAPHPRLRPWTQIASMTGETGPFGLSVRFPLQSRIAGAERPSISASLAGIEPREGWYRPDLANDINSVPTLSYVDVLRSRVPHAEIASRDVIVAPTFMGSEDFHPLPFGGQIPGAYYHVIGAHTLKAGPPVSWGWMPALIIASLTVLFAATKPKMGGWLVMGMIVFLILAPIILDSYAQLFDIMPALLCLGLFGVRMAWLRMRSVDRRSGLLQLEELRTASAHGDCDVIALKICNLGEIASFSERKGDGVIQELIHRIRGTEADAQFAFARDTLVWLRARLPPAELNEHLRGMHAVAQSRIKVDGELVDIRVAVGADTNHQHPDRQRVENAIQCAEDAAQKGEPCLIADGAHLADRHFRLELLAEFDAAIRKGELELAFQPKVCLASGRIVGAEALVRWKHHTKGYIDPEVLVETAEAHNRIDNLTMYVLNNALHEAQPLIKIDPLFKVAVNVSPLSLSNFMFPYKLTALLERHKFDPRSLIIEVTEKCSIDNPEIASSLSSIAKLGVVIAIDDFGTGHATFNYLKRVPEGEVKIDRSFITNLATSVSDQGIVKAAIAMSHSLNRVVVAEGIETQEVADMLQAMGCNLGQGFLYSRPVPSWSIYEMLKHERASTCFLSG